MMQSSSAITVDPNASAAPTGDQKTGRDSRLDDLVALLGENMPHDQNSPYYSYLSSFMSLRLMLLKPTPSPEEAEQQGTLLSSYSSYMSSGRAKNDDVAVMIARDYMFLKQQHQTQPQPQPSPQLQAIMSSHSVHPSMEHLSLPTHSNSIVSNNIIQHPGTYIPFAGNQISNGTIQQQQQQQYAPLSTLQQQNQGSIQQQLDNNIDTPNDNNQHLNSPPNNSLAPNPTKNEP